MGNKNLSKAKTNKNDEFYTVLSDIEMELSNHRKHFEGKHIFMNCDDPEESNFWRYFKLNFDFFGLKKITSTHYHDTKPTYRLDYDGDRVIKTPLKENGDFRSPEAIQILKEADIVVTNPPFSLFREYVAQLMEYEKSFIIIGNMNAITYKETFPLLKNGDMWLGQNYGSMEFIIPSDSPMKSGQRVDEEGVKYQKFGNIAWYTNLDVPRLHERIILYREYNKEDYPSYDNYDAIEVGRVSDIPEGYEGVMGVPITFLTKFNPEQFKIVGLTSGRDEFESTPTKRYENALQHNRDGSTTSGSKANTRATLLLDSEPEGIYYTADNAGGPLRILYARILIQRRES